MNQRYQTEQGAGDVDPSAGIWACERCGRRIQVITDSEVEKIQPFVCVCGATMKPGEEHTVPDRDMQSRVIDE
jgi:hypothetical protein